MDTEHVAIENKLVTRAAVIYIPISLGSAALFYAAATLAGEYSLVARIGGTVWVALLSLIVAMPLVISGVKKWGKDHV